VVTILLLLHLSESLGISVAKAFWFALFIVILANVLAGALRWRT